MFAPCWDSFGSKIAKQKTIQKSTEITCPEKVMRVSATVHDLEAAVPLSYNLDSQGIILHIRITPLGALWARWRIYRRKSNFSPRARPDVWELMIDGVEVEWGDGIDGSMGIELSSGLRKLKG